MTSTRIQKETEKLQKDPPPGLVAAPTKENVRYVRTTPEHPEHRRIFTVQGVL